MEDIRSNPEEENLELPEAREEMENLDEATHEAEARVEKTGGYEEAEVIEGLVKGMVKGSPDKVELTELPGMSDASLEETEKLGDKDEVTPINLPDTKGVHIAASQLPIPKDVPGSLPFPFPREADEVMAGTDSVSMEAPDPGPHPPPELEGEESILGTAPTEIPLEMDKSDSVETVGLKWYQPIPGEDESAMVKGIPESAEQTETPGVAVTDAEQLGKRDSEIEATPINIPEEPPPDEEEPVQE